MTNKDRFEPYKGTFSGPMDNVQIPVGVPLELYTDKIAQDNTCADFQIGDIVTWDGTDEYEVLALHPCGGSSDAMTLRCTQEGDRDRPYIPLGEEYDCCKCRRFDLKRRGNTVYDIYR